METKTIIPELTFEPFGKEMQTPAATPENAEVMGQTMLSEEEQAQVNAFASKIDIANSKMILQYGAGAQKKMADFSGTAMENVKTKDFGEVGQLLSNVVTELKDFNAEEDNRFLGVFRKASNKIQKIKTQYANVETNVSQICKVLEDHQSQMMKDVTVLDQMYELNLAYFKELSMYILAGKKKLEEVRATTLHDLMQKAQRTGLAEDAQAVRDMVAMCDRFEKKIHDLELTRMISLQTAPQIRLIQENDTLMIEKIQSTIVNTIPLWKSQMVIALGVEHSLQAAEAQRQVTDLTNELLKKNAEKLKMATIETAKESERGVVDMETLKATNKCLISTLDEVLKIQQEGHRKRKEAELEMRRMENELKEKLLQIQN